LHTAGPGAHAGGAALPQPELSIDYDLDSDVNPHEPDVDHVPLPDVAGPRVAAAASRLVRSYYAAAASGDGARACALMSSPLAESVVEAYGSQAETVGAGAETCAQVTSDIFRHEQERLRQANAALRVVEVRTMQREASVRIAVRGSRKSQYMLLVSERGAWKVGKVLPSEQRIEVN
jgi:hypothetical protein